MKPSALLLASTALLLAGPAGAETSTPLHRLQSHETENRILLAQEEGELPAAEPQAEELFKRQEKEAEEAKRTAQEEAERQLKEQRAAERDAKRQADEAAQEAAETQKQVEERARRQADREAAKQAEKAERQAQDEKAKRITEEEQRKTESELRQRAERAKRETDTEIRETEQIQEKATERAKRDTRAAQREAEKEAERAAEQAKRQADRAVRRQQEEQPAPTSDPERTPAGEAEKATPERSTTERDPGRPTPGERRASERPARSEEAAPTDEQAAPPRPSDQAEQPAPAPDDSRRAQQPPAPDEAAPRPENAAPALDSAKEAAPATREGDRPLRRLQREPDGVEEAAPAPAAPTDQAERPAPPPSNDAEAQRLESPISVESIRTEEGRRVDRAPRWERPREAQVLQRFEDRTLIEVNNNIYVESPDRPRLSRDAREVYYEDLPRQRVRETIVRPNGVQIVTIRNRYGDVIQRSRIMPDGNEILLSYTPDDDRDELVAWRDPGEDLPPLRLAISEDEYIFDDPDAPEDEVYAFLSQPPVEPVERTYSIDEVKRSARIRDKLRRIDLDTITFGFGSAEIAEDQVARMENVANAMLEILKKNPAETFLIEGHTDAVGSDRANLVLSDRRAEAVAEALTNVFEIPPENMATQGYGERYLKIDTPEPEQENRRVAIRRITPLVAPVASR
ncbi:OmpA family protein [Phyllobacteriaceae bacterium JZ32]